MPAGIALDQAGNLWVADRGNNRVLEFNTPATNVTADHVIGQTNFTSHVSATSKTGLWGPTAVAFDLHANLYVADTTNNRVLEYDIPLQTGIGYSACHSTPCAASLVFGQASFTSAVCGYTGGTTALCGPDGVAVDGSNRVYISDSINSRVLRYTESSNPPINVTAATVFGQGSNPPSFTKTGCNDGDRTGDVNGLGPDSLCFPGGIAVDKTNLGVAGNSRVLEYDAPFAGCTTGPCVGPGANRAFGQNGLFSLIGCANGAGSNPKPSAGLMCSP